MDEAVSDVRQLRWGELSDDLRQDLTDRLNGLWGATGDEQAFDSLAIDKQQALLLVSSRLYEKGLWQYVQQVTNVYGEGGVGIEFTSSAVLESILASRKDFTRRLARHRDTTGGFYERGRAEAVLHFLYLEQSPPKWYVHFDLYSPVHSAVSAFRHLRHEYFRNVRPNWQVIKQRLNAKASPHE